MTRATRRGAALEVSCHCGAVRIALARRPRTVTECTCSICRRYGALWAYCTNRTVQILTRPGALAKYAWRNRTLEFHRCRRCGCVTHHERARKRPGSTVGVNARLLPPQVLAGIPVRLFDGATRLGRGTF
jgi:hypothetical protein